MGKICHPPETVEKVTCPACGHVGRADASPHIYFDQNKLALRCQQCKHVWKADPETPTQSRGTLSGDEVDRIAFGSTPEKH